MRIINAVFEFFEGLVDPFQNLKTYEPPYKLLPYVWHYVRQVKWAFLAMMLLGFMTALVEAAMFSYVGQLVDILTAFETQGSKALGWKGLLAQFGSTLLLMFFVVAILRLVIIALDALVEEQVIVPGFFVLMRWQSHKHIVGQSLSFFENDLSGRISQKVFQSGQATGDMMISLLQIIWFIVIYTLTTAGIFFSLDFQLGLIVAFWMAGFYFIASYFIPRVREHARITADTASGVSGRMVDTYSNIQTTKLYAMESTNNDWVLEASKKHRAAIIKFTRVLTLLRVNANLLNGVAISLIGYVVIDMWLNDQTTLGAVAFVLALSLRLRLLLNRLLGNLNGFFRNVGVTQNTMDLVAKPHQIQDHPDAVDFEFKGGKIEFQNVSFHYDKVDGVIDELNLKIEPGEKIGIVGPSGAGKTTLLHLLMRYYDPESGAVVIDGQNIAKVKQDSLRSNFSFVQQDVQLFHRSVFENIAQGSAFSDKDKVVEAAKLANAHEFIMKLEDAKGNTGYDVQVGERGVKLSGGQRQRIAIARALYRDAPILVLDEATSQLDSGVEEAIQENLSKLMAGKTVFVVAHRLSTLSKLDRLIVLDKGKIVDEGEHKALISKNGLYASLWATQTKV